MELFLEFLIHVEYSGTDSNLQVGLFLHLLKVNRWSTNKIINTKIKLQCQYVNAQPAVEYCILKRN